MLRKIDFQVPHIKTWRKLFRFFLGKIDHPVDRACFGVPGPVRGKIAKLQNLPWIVDTEDLTPLLGHNRVGLINDLEANAYGLRELDENEFTVLNTRRT